MRVAASASVRTPSGARPRLRLQPPVPSDSTQARPSARITGWPLRDHLPYQNGPVARSRMKGLALGFGAIQMQLTGCFGRNVCPGNGAGNCHFGQRPRATFLARNAYSKGILTY